LDEQNQRIADDLAGIFQGELRFDSVARELYSTDASIYQIHPLGVAFPRHTDDVVTLAQYACENHIPLIARGSGSGLAGGALGAGLIVDFSRHMREILALDSDIVRVQTGVVRDQLNQFLRPYGRYYPPDPAGTAVTTVGGMLAVDAGGSHAVRVGSARNHVKSIEIVLADGTCFEAGTHHRWSSETGSQRRNEIVTRINQIVTEHQLLIQERQKPQIRNCSGYHLRSVLQNDEIHLPRLLVGSEGTLALFTSATLQTLAIPEFRTAALVVYSDLEQALEAVPEIVTLEPSACDLLDRRLLSLARDSSLQFASLIPATAAAGLLIEHVGYSERQAQDLLARTLRLVRELDPSVVVAAEAHTFDDVEQMWSLPQRVVPLLNQLRGETRPWPLVEDIAVPPAALRDFLLKAQRVFQKHWITASLYAHAASGQVHFRPFLKSPSPENAEQIESLARELYEIAIACGGTISGEHGNGLARTAFIRTEYGPLYRIFQKVKETFDPEGLLNPDKIISNDPRLTIRNFRRPLTTGEPNPLVPLQLEWRPDELAETTSRCNGCGDCRTQSASARMCPFFHVDQLEDASPRGKASLMRSIVNGTIDPKTFSTDQAKTLADLCFNCKQCHMECPSQVNIPALAIEAKAQNVAAMGLSNADYILSRAHSFGRLGCRISPFANWALAHSGIRWLMEQLLGISQHRRLPRFSRGEFLNSVQGHPQNVEAADAVYFVDHFVNYHDHELGRAFLRILQHHGIRVAIPAGQVASGMAMVSVGDLDAAREMAETNVRVLAEYAREGRPIICTEPTAAVCLKYEYPRLIRSPDVELVAEHTIEAGTYLLNLQQKGKLNTGFSELPLQLKYHTPCHLKYLTPQTPLATLLKNIPGLQIEHLQAGCSGIAGAFGITARNFNSSMTMGKLLVEQMESLDLHAGVTECSSCRMQMEQQASVPTLHPLKILALSYGLLPELAQRLQQMRPAGLTMS